MKGVNSIQETFLKPNFLMALEFDKGFIFARVLRRRICQWKPYSLIDSDGSVVDISPSSHQTELRFRDPRNTQNSILYLKDNTMGGFPWIMHGAIGIKPQYVRMYLRLPESQAIPGKFPNVDPVRPSSGDDFGFINSLKSPYEFPTDYLEIIIPPKVEVGAEYYNTDETGRIHRPVLNLSFAIYWFEPLKQGTHDRLIGKIARREVPASFFKIGFGDFPYEFREDLQRDWNVTPLKLKDAVTIGGGQ